MVSDGILKRHIQPQCIKFLAQIAADTCRIGTVGDRPVRRLTHDIQYHIVEQIALIKIAVAVSILHIAVVHSKTITCLEIVYLAYASLDSEVSLKARTGCKRIFDTSETVGIVTDILVHHLLHLYLSHIVFEIMTGLVLLKMLGHCHKTLAHALCKLLVAYLYNILHIEDLDAQQT